MNTSLIIICAVAFLGVLCVLCTLAVFIRVLTRLFPDDSPEADPALMQALEDAVGQAFPGATMVSVELEKKD